MVNRPFYLTGFLILVMIISTSCDKFINLGDDSYSKDHEDGLPEDLTGSEDSDRWDEGGVDFPGDSGDSGNSGDSGEESYSDEDNWMGNDDDDLSDIDTETPPKLLEEYPFPEDFTNDNCECGVNPGYNPVCCKGISVFNACFANCYFLYSEGKICSSYSQGVCDSIPRPETDESPDDEEHNDQGDTPDEPDDTDVENPDNDEPVEDNDEDLTSDEDNIPDNECGCYPSDTEFLCCYKNSTVIISSCMADCHCNGAYTPCF